MDTIKGPEDALFKLRIGGAYQDREEGFIGIDCEKTDAVDFVIDLKSFPWPIEDNAVDLIFSANYLHFLNGPERIPFMNECYRILRMGAKISLAVPPYSSIHATSHPLVGWPPLSEASFAVFNKGYREREKIRECGIKTDFDYSYGFSYDPEIEARNDVFKAEVAKKWNNQVQLLHVTLIKKTSTV